MLGIGVITYNRCNALRNTLNAIKDKTLVAFDLVVADDGSSDDTLDFLRETNIAHVTGANGGIAWNKNRALFYLNTFSRCDVIILFEDDTFPVKSGWESEWIDAAKNWGHANIAIPWRKAHWSGGAGTASDPIRSDFVSGQVSVFSAEALNAVGYLDTRFRTYGYEHVEHTCRMITAGFGGTTEPREFYLLTGGVEVTSEPSFGTPERVAANLSISRSIAEEPISFGSPWRNEEERIKLLSEMTQAKVRASTGR